MNVTNETIKINISKALKTIKKNVIQNHFHPFSRKPCLLSKQGFLESKTRLVFEVNKPCFR